LAEEIKGKKKACIELMAKGETDEGAIAEKAGISCDTLRRWKGEEAFKAAHSEAIKNEMAYAAGRALRAEIDMIEKGGREALSAAKDLLDRSGFKQGGRAVTATAIVPGYVDDIPEDIL